MAAMCGDALTSAARPRVRAVGGNQVVINHGYGECSFLAHLTPWTLRVTEGDAVERGVDIGEAGSSGASTGPHLYFQVCDGPDPLLCAGIPVRRAGLESPLPAQRARSMRPIFRFARLADAVVAADEGERSGAKGTGWSWYVRDPFGNAIELKS